MRIGVAGLGHWGSILASNFSEYGIVSYYDPIISNDIYNRYDTFDELLKNSDKIVLAVPAKKLQFHALQSLSHGVDTFCEKPILSSSIYEELCEKAETTNSVFFVDNLYYYNYSIDCLFKEIGDVNDILHIDIDWWNGMLVRKGVNVFTDLGWHPLTILYKLLGEGDHRYADVIFTLDGKFVTIYIVYKADISVNIKLSWFDKEKARRINVYKKNGTTLVWNEIDSTITKYGEEGKEIITIAPRNTVNVVCNEFIKTKDLLPNRQLTDWCSLITDEVIRRMGIGV